MKDVAGRLVLSAVLAAASLASVSAHAQSPGSDTGFYIGGNVGQSRTDIKASDIRLPAGFNYTAFSSDETDIGYKLFGGYRLHRNVAIEAGYTDLGRFTFNGITTPAGTVSGRIKNSGWNADVVGILPLQNNFSLLGRVGAYYSETKSSFTAGGNLVVPNPNPKERDTSVKVGLGAQYDFTPMLGVRAEWDYFRKVGKENTTGEANIHLLSVGMIFKFR
jgi:OOP family OmpA-OmpF porin